MSFARTVLAVRESPIRVAVCRSIAKGTFLRIGLFILTDHLSRGDRLN
jgi:hypothetical protein